ncbi:hypothetical protein THTE_1806 [Thermogutta terrifontis]|uniref:Uncharacterized protein n=1 Tax=Thermogutta terrifontis TaxID=1331910 RepID=A0A286REL7_9BACT|nr:hypothetical protein THTE_1806 [Thermogutta terrifontis]
MLKNSPLVFDSSTKKAVTWRWTVLARMKPPIVKSVKVQSVGSLGT